MNAFVFANRSTYVYSVCACVENIISLVHGNDYEHVRAEKAA